MTHDNYWPVSPKDVPLVFYLTCKNDGKVYRYSYENNNKKLILITKAFIWSILRRSAALGHNSRETIKSGVKWFEEFLLSLAQVSRPSKPGDINESLLREYAAWLKVSSGLSYRTASGIFRIMHPLLRQWEGQKWAAADLSMPPFLFPKSNSSFVKRQNGYSFNELKQIAQIVINDIEKSKLIFNAKGPNNYFGALPPLEDVAPETSRTSRLGSRWRVLEYRIWWWENNCGCRRLEVEEITGKPGGYSFLIGYLTISRARPSMKFVREKLLQFYQEINAGDDYIPRYIGCPPPIKYDTKWKKPEYIDWVLQNELAGRSMSVKDLKKTHPKLHVALREHHGGGRSFLEKNGIRPKITINDLIPYFIGLLISTALNPSVIAGLKIDCLIKNPFDDDSDSIKWKKLRANKTGLSIPLNRSIVLAPSRLVGDLIEITAPYRLEGNEFLFHTHASPKRSKHRMDYGAFVRAIKKWFLKNGLIPLDPALQAEGAHWAKNFRPAVAKHYYEATGSLERVKTVLAHERLETTAEYVGKLPEAQLIFRRGLHIEAILIGAVSGVAEAKKFLKTSLASPAQIEETMVAHCRDIKNPPWNGQKKGADCSAQNACLYCENLVITVEDIFRYFSMRYFYENELKCGRLTKNQHEALLGEKIFAFENNILPRYDSSIISKVMKKAKESPSPEFKVNHDRDKI